MKLFIDTGNVKEVEQLASVSSKLLQAGTKRILLEKPGGINQEELQNKKLIPPLCLILHFYY